MQTARINYAGAMIELPSETIVKNWLASLQEQPAVSASRAGVPFIGGYWPGQGGIYAGVIRSDDGAPDRHVIVPTASESKIAPSPWGEYGTAIPDCESNLNGHANTAAMVEFGNELALKVAALRIEGHSDFYLPARHELRLCYLNVPELLDKEWYWSSTQYSALSAFYQDFGGGYQGNGGKSYKLRARAVRSIQVSN